jgi:hypothetical protein
MSSVQKKYVNILDAMGPVPRPPVFQYDLNPKENEEEEEEEFIPSPLPSPLRSPSKKSEDNKEEVLRIIKNVDYETQGVMIPLVPIPFDPNSDPYEEDYNKLEIVMPKITYLSIENQNPKYKNSS